MKLKLSTNSYGKVIILICFIITIFAIGFIILFELKTKNIVTDAQTIDKLIDLQSITLAVTGTSISLISIICTVFFVEREQKFEKLKRSMEEITIQYNQNLTEMKAQEKLLEDNSRCLEDLLLINNMFLEKRKEFLLEKSTETSNSTYIKYLYIRTLHNNIKSHNTETQKNVWCKTIIKYGKELLLEFKGNDKTSEFERTRLYNIYIMIADAYYYLAISFIENANQNDDLLIKENFDKSIKYYGEADKLYTDSDGYVENSIGLINYWKYKHFVCSKKEENSDYLDKSIKHYKLAIERCNFNPMYYNNLGVSYLQKATGTDQEIYWEIADKTFKSALRIDNKATKAAINIADIEIKKIRNILKLEQDPIIIQNFKKEITSEELTELNKSYNRAKKYFNFAATYNLYFPNVYYKKAQLLIYYLHYNELLTEEDVDEIKRQIQELLSNARNINPTATGTFYIERLFYDSINNFEEAQRINESIRKFNKQNAEKWDKLYDEYQKTKIKEVKIQTTSNNFQ